jgi:hypothetical protein
MTATHRKVVGPPPENASDGEHSADAPDATTYPECRWAGIDLPVYVGRSTLGRVPGSTARPLPEGLVESALFGYGWLKTSKLPPKKRS